MIIFPFSSSDSIVTCRLNAPRCNFPSKMRFPSGDHITSLILSPSLTETMRRGSSPFRVITHTSLPMLSTKAIRRPSGEPAASDTFSLSFRGRRLRMGSSQSPERFVSRSLAVTNRLNVSGNQVSPAMSEIPFIKSVVVSLLSISRIWIPPRSA